MAPQCADDLLRSLLAQAGWSGQDLARAVNLLGAESGLRLRYDRTSVAHWLSGTRPRPPVPDLIAEAFTRRLGRTIAYPAPDRPEHLPRAGSDGVERLRTLHANRRRLLRGTVYSLTALPSASHAPPMIAPGPQRTVGADRLTGGHLEAAREMSRHFADCDTVFGGGHSAAALAAYLSLDLAPRLRQPAAPALRRAMFGVATELTYLCAFMHVDQEQHPAAQRYYLAALHLAAENHDRTAYATTLRALSVQAHALGHHHHAVGLAAAALSAAPPTVQNGTRAFLYGQAAVAAAGVGDHDQALHHLRQAEEHLERGTGTDAPIGPYHQACLAHQQAAVFAALGDTTAAVMALTRSIRHRPARERRSRAIALAALGQLHLQNGHLNPAITSWQRFLDDYPHLSSRRATTALSTLRQSLRPHLHHPAAAVLLARATGHETGVRGL